MKIYLRKFWLYSFCYFFLCFACAHAQYIILNYQNYKSYWDQSAHIPRMVTYKLTRSMLQCNNKVPRCNSMKPDPYNYSLTNDNLCYNLKGFDKGHCMPANNNKCCSLCMEQCFYYSNIAPQLHKLNIGNWQLLECAERNEAIKYDSIDVITGNVGCFQKMGVQQISIPRYWYKIIYIPITKTYQCWIFNNTGFSDETLPVYPVPVSYFENLCNYKIIYGHVILH